MRVDDEQRDFLETALEGLHRVGPDGTILWANQATLDLLGCDREDFVGHHIAEFHVDRGVIDDILATLVRGEAVQGREVTLRGKDGALRYVLVDSNGLWRDGQFVHSCWFARDIAGRRLAERAIRESEARLRLALEAGCVGVWEWNVATSEVIWSPSLERIHGLAPGTFAGTFDAYLADVHPDDRHRVVASITRTINERSEHHVEYRVMKRDGEVRWVEGRGQVVCDAWDRPRYMLGVCQDVTERKRLAAENRESEARFRTLADSTAVMIWVDDADGGCEFVNRACLQFFGATLEEVRGFGWIRRVHPDDVERYTSALLRALAAREPLCAEVRLRAANGEYRRCESYALPRFAESGNFLGCVGITTDLTASRMTGEAARKDDERAEMEASVTEKLKQIGAALTGPPGADALLQAITDVATEFTTAEFGAFLRLATDRESCEALPLCTVSGTRGEAFAHLARPRATPLFAPTFRGDAAIRLDDVTTDSRYGKNHPYRGIPVGHLPVRSYLAVPVKARSGEVPGVLLFGHSKAGVFTLQHEQLAEGIALLTSIALENARLRAGLAGSVLADAPPIPER
jgi:PAS domain S-box-containing protein